jgi:hypothetical protein
MATASTLSLATAPTLPSAPPTQYLYPSTANTDPTIYLPMYSKEAATIAKIYTDFYTNRILIGELVTTC